MEDQTSLLFVYGTLREDSQHKMARLLSSAASVVGPAFVLGRLFDIGEYPGMILDGSGHHLTHGQIFKLANADETLAHLDVYEEASSEFPEPRQYVRKKVTARQENGNQIEVWVYVYNWPVEGKTLIQSGDYAQFKRQQAQQS
ncbi:MAG: gamma-glutamylcyclotransferase family protein [Alphaproteobacteria bacterium]|uniref:gamma-glutamylcyclotransferase family protein n=1 Tax=Pyruvatibacter sp. HU-CL02332 TaxID=3127650 RepID=UPI002967CF2C|nr:gamma-glutamylcyclotransferase family protein [Alphaproteobacteria bacterium]